MSVANLCFLITSCNLCYVTKTAFHKICQVAISSWRHLLSSELESLHSALVVVTQQELQEESSQSVYSHPGWHNWHETCCRYNNSFYVESMKSYTNCRSFKRTKYLHGKEIGPA